MIHASIRIHTLFVIAVVCCLSSCSTYRVYESYDLTEDRAKPFYTSADADVLVQIREDILFGSIGVLGMPIIPVYIKLLENKSIIADATFTLRREYQFLLNTRPCLILEPAKSLCANEVVIDALGMYQDDGTMYKDGKRRWNHVPGFDWHDRMIITHNGEETSSSVDRDQIYSNYNYRKQPMWNILVVRLKYTFLCQERCPDRFRLDAKGFLTIDGAQTINDEYVYQKQHHKEYKFITKVQ